MSIFAETGKPMPNAINNSNCIYRYFYYSLLDFDISDNDFKYVMKLPYENIKSRIKDWVENNKSISLNQHFERYSSPEECKKIIESIFYFESISTSFYLDNKLILSHVNSLTINENEKKGVRQLNCVIVSEFFSS